MSTSTKIIKALIQTQVNALINSAPGTLDTLGEIAAALAVEDSAIAALTTVNNTQNTNIAALQTSSTSQTAQINALMLRNGIFRRTVTADLTLTLTDKETQNIINSGATVRNVLFPASPPLDTEFLVINHITSGANLNVNSNLIAPGERYSAIHDGTEWVEL